MISKVALRRQQLARLAKSEPQLALDGDLLLKQLLETRAWQDAQTIALTVSGPLEVPTAPIIAAATALGKTVVLPRVMPRRQLRFFIDPGPSKRIVSPFGIAEPPEDPNTLVEEPDLIVVPGLAFARDSRRRVGFGGGYYDRFLSSYSGNTIALVPRAMAFSSATWAIEDFDIAIEELLTLEESTQ